MLEVISPASLAERLNLLNENDLPSLSGIAFAARAAVSAWRSPPRQRVSTYLARQLIAVGVDDEAARQSVRETLDSLLEIGEFASIRLDGKTCLVLARASAVRISEEICVLLGDQPDDLIPAQSGSIARHVRDITGEERALTFSEWIGPPDFTAHAARRGGLPGNLHDYWASLSASLQQQGQPIGLENVRILSLPPGPPNHFFGQVSAPAVAGRWTRTVGDGIWCAARPGRNEQHWHPILLHVGEGKGRSFDLFDWDEWNWALLARGRAVSAPERQNWSSDMLAFEHPVPAQFVRALKLLGCEGERKWTWSIAAPAFACFEEWQNAEVWN